MTTTSTELREPPKVSGGQEPNGHLEELRVDPIGLMRRVGLGETLRIALMGNDERVSADTALRIGLVSEVVSPERLWARAHEIAATIAASEKTAAHNQRSRSKGKRAQSARSLIFLATDTFCERSSRSR